MTTISAASRAARSVALALLVERDALAPLAHHGGQHAQDLVVAQAVVLVPAPGRDVTVLQRGEDQAHRRDRDLVARLHCDFQGVGKLLSQHGIRLPAVAWEAAL